MESLSPLPFLLPCSAVTLAAEIQRNQNDDEFKRDKKLVCDQYEIRNTRIYYLWMRAEMLRTLCHLHEIVLTQSLSLDFKVIEIYYRSHIITYLYIS